jgi:Protein of unknown function (DUF3800)
MDESGHDHRHAPYEVRGGIAVSDHRLWNLINELQEAEVSSFGVLLREYGSEIKGKKLLEKKRFKWATSRPVMSGEERRRKCMNFLQKGLRREQPTGEEFAAYGQASLRFVRRAFEICASQQVMVFASCIPRGQRRSKGDTSMQMLRKDLVYLLERFYYFLETRHPAVRGLLVFDEVERTQAHRIITRLIRYFRRSTKGQQRAQRIIPSPFFVASDLTYPIQVADIVIYCVNWAYRIPGREMDEPVRQELADTYLDLLNRLVYRGKVETDGEEHAVHGVVFVPEPFTGQSA